MQQEIIEGFRLSPQQKHLWGLQQENQILPYQSWCTILIEGNLDIEALKAALQSVIDRHEILRTTFRRLPDMTIPLQVINDSSLPPIHQRDLRDLAPSAQAAEIEVIFQQMSQLPFDLDRGPILQLSLVVQSQNKHLLILGLPALCADRVAIENLLREISCYYGGQSSSELDSEPMQYADFSEWQNELLEAEDTEIGRKHWNQQDLSTLFNKKLPFEAWTAEKKEFKPASITTSIDPQTVAKLEAIARQYNTSTSIFMLTCWQVLLWRLAGESDIIVGVEYDGRKYEELKTALGLMAKYLPIHAHLEKDQQFLNVIEQIARSIDFGEQWQDYFSWELGKLSSSDFFPTSFSFQERDEKYSVGDLSFSIDKQFVCIDRFKVKLACVQGGNCLRADFYYDSNLLRGADIELWAAQFQTLLLSAIENPLAAIGELEILSDVERERLLFEFNDTRADYPKNHCIHQLIEEQATRKPDKVAVVFENRQLTYAELNARANQLARYLQDMGVGPEVPVAICLERSVEMVVGILAILKAGGAYVPLDPDLPRERLTFMLEDTRTPVLLTERRLLENIPQHQARVVFLDAADWETIAEKRDDNFLSKTLPENLAYIIYTSGSTGKPKGVAVEHRQLLNYLNGILERLKLTTRASFALVSTFAADLGHTVVFPALCQGNCLHVISQERASNPEAIADYFASHGGIDCIKIVPSHLRTLLACSQNPARILPRHQLILGGEASSWDLVKKVQELAPNCTIFNHYGPTETTVGAIAYQVDKSQTNCRSATVPLGRPLPNTQIFLLNAHLQPVPIGVPGELCIGGAGLARGYLNRPELTAKKFIAHPLSNLDISSGSKARLYRTGDLARYLPDGNIEFLGRLDEQVKIRGFRIELGEIETVLRQHPAVRETVAAALDGKTEDKRLVAYVVPNQQPAPTIGELRRFLQQQLPDYAIPSTFVMLEALPFMPNGKLDRQALPAIAAFHVQRETSFVAPRTPEENLLTEIWSKVLGVERVGIEDNFFELGGDSILSIQIIARANQAGLRLKPMQLFQHQTIAKLAAAADKTPPIQSEQRLITGPVPLTPIQCEFFQQNLMEPHHSNMSILLEIPQTIAPNILEKAINHLLEHHDALRLRFEYGEMGWQAVNASNDCRVPFSYIDLSSLSGSERASAIEKEIGKIQAALDLSIAPLMRVALFDLGDRLSGRLAIVIHHLIADGVSWRIFLDDLQKASQQLSRGEAIQLAKKTTSFQHWATRLTDYAKSAALVQELDYWQAITQSSVCPLPRDYSDQPNTVATERTISVSLSPEDTQALLNQVPAAYHTQINDLLLTALVQTLRGWTGENTLLVELEEPGREALFDGVDLSRTVGCFTTRFPVLLHLDGMESASVGSVLKSVKEQLRQIPNRGTGYGLLRHLNGKPEIILELEALPQPEVSFNYLGQFDQMLPESTDFPVAEESRVAELSLKGIRPHLIAIDGIVLDRRLQVHWTYSENAHQSSTIENLARGFVEALKAIIHHCLSTRGGYTPSDFPLVKLNQQQIEQLSAQFDLEDIYGLSPLQHGMIFHCLHAPESKIYCQQKVFTLQGNLNVAAFKQGWQQVVNRHPSLRTIFIWDELDEPVQVVLQRVEVSWGEQDWSWMSSKEREERLQAYLKADLERGFSLRDAPLMRLAIIQVATDIHQVIWSHHHLLLDGWCNSIILKEVFSFYEAFSQGRDLHLESSHPYRDYIAWLQQQDFSPAEEFWRQALTGVRAPTRLGAERIPENLPSRELGYGQKQIQLSAEVTSALQSFARQHHLTVNILFHGAWALLLSRYSGEEDVIFGVTVSGRPAELPGVESIVGLSINTLPVRVRVSPHSSLLSWLDQLQEQQAELLQHQYSSLVEIQGWSEVPRGTPMFESFVTFQNYPLDISLQEPTNSLKIIEISSFFETNYPLIVTVEPGSALVVRIDYTHSRFNTATIDRILMQIQTLLENIPVNSAHPLSNISLATEAESQQLINSFNADLEIGDAGSVDHY